MTDPTLPDYAIYCASEEGCVVLDIIRRTKGEISLVFVDDDEALWDTTIEGVPVVGGADALWEFDSNTTAVIVAYGAGR